MVAVEVPGADGLSEAVAVANLVSESLRLGVPVWDGVREGVGRGGSGNPVKTFTDIPRPGEFVRGVVEFKALEVTHSTI